MKRWDWRHADGVRRARCNVGVCGQPSTLARLTLLASSIPIAITCNVARLVVTAALFAAVSSEAAERFFHDFAGWTMMQLAVIMLIAELWVMAQLVIEDPVKEPS